MGVLVLLAVMVLVASDGMEWGMSLGDWRRTMAVMTLYAMGVVDGEDRGNGVERMCCCVNGLSVRRAVQREREKLFMGPMLFECR